MLGANDTPDMAPEIPLSANIDAAAVMLSRNAEAVSFERIQNSDVSPLQICCYQSAVRILSPSKNPRIRRRAVPPAASPA
jgi:hypothetical protein